MFKSIFVIIFISLFSQAFAKPFFEISMANHANDSATAIGFGFDFDYIAIDYHYEMSLKNKEYSVSSTYAYSHALSTRIKPVSYSWGEPFIRLGVRRYQSENTIIDYSKFPYIDGFGGAGVKVNSIFGSYVILEAGFMGGGYYSHNYRELHGLGFYNTVSIGYQF
jgi:hypothetical protein